jgi:formylglycine-generating enzyme required for sulfatase activity
MNLRLTLVCLALSARAVCAQTTTLEPYTEKITGTIVSFDMVPVGSIWVSQTEVTWDMYDEFLFGTEPLPAPPAGTVALTRPTKPYVRPGEAFGHDGYPALGMSIHAAREFARWISTKTGRKYRLPTSEEWTRLCEAGGGARSAGTAANGTSAVSSLARDKAGLQGMVGNVAEWVTAGADSMVAGGSWMNTPAELTCTTRAHQISAWNVTDPQLPKSRWWLTDAPFVGMRLVREQ